jgi:hypothetical protein
MINAAERGVGRWFEITRSHSRHSGRRRRLSSLEPLTLSLPRYKSEFQSHGVQPA